jgi:zinc transport system permease protein
MKNALIAIIIITPLFGIIGTMIVSNKMAFFSDALGHSALTGVALGVILGISNINISMSIFAIIFALVLNKIKRSNLLSNDTIISIFSSLGIALGLAILSFGGNFNKYSSLLLGDILSISSNEILYLLIIFVITLIFWILSFNKLHSMSISTSLARSKGINTKLIDNIFVIIVALIVVLSIRWIGILLINALLIIPAASSKNISKDIREYHFFSIVFSLFSGLLGLVISYFLGIATGPTIVIISSVIFFFTYIFRVVKK